MLYYYWGQHKIKYPKTSPGSNGSGSGPGNSADGPRKISGHVLIPSTCSKRATEDPRKLRPSLRFSLLGDHGLENARNYYLYIQRGLSPGWSSSFSSFSGETSFSWMISSCMVSFSNQFKDKKRGKLDSPGGTVLPFSSCVGSQMPKILPCKGRQKCIL